MSLPSQQPLQLPCHTRQDFAVEAVAHAEAAKAIDGTSAQAFAWYGQAIQAKAKAVDGTLEQAHSSRMSRM